MIILWGSCGSESLGSKTLGSESLGSKTLVPGTSNRRSVGCSGSASMLVVSTREASRRTRGSEPSGKKENFSEAGKKGEVRHKRGFSASFYVFSNVDRFL